MTKTRLVFWQNCLSPHMLPFMVHLLDDERVSEVVLVAYETILSERASMGWTTPQCPGIEQVEIIIKPSCDKVEDIIKKAPESSCHLFSGIRAFASVFDAFKRSMKYNTTRCMITERPNTFAFGRANGKPLWFHWLRWKIQDYKYIPYCHSVFAIGDTATTFFKSVSNSWKVYPFCYCTNSVDEETIVDKTDDMPSIVFVGSLCWRKSVSTLLHAASNAYKLDEDFNIRIRIIGDGPERGILEQFVNNNNLENVEFLGIKKQTEIPRLLQENDILILPSVHDGWGAVVNEALQNGLYTIVSDQCGAKDLIVSPNCGYVFKGGDTKQLTQILLDVSHKIDEIRSKKTWRREWAAHCIDGKSVAKYMIDCLTIGNATLPWEKAR